MQLTVSEEFSGEEEVIVGSSMVREFSWLLGS